MKKHVLIGELLVKSRVVHKKQIEEALNIQKKIKMRVGEILLKLGYVNSQKLTQKLSEQASIPFVKLKPKIVDKELIKLFPFELLYKNNVLPLYEVRNKLHVAIGDPTNHEVVNKLKDFTSKKIVLACAEPKQIIRLMLNL